MFRWWLIFWFWFKYYYFVQKENYIICIVYCMLLPIWSESGENVHSTPIKRFTHLEQYPLCLPTKHIPLGAGGRQDQLGRGERDPARQAGLGPDQPRRRLQRRQEPYPGTEMSSCCCCLPCNHCSNWTWVVEEILAFGARLRSTHCREFNYCITILTN